MVWYDEQHIPCICVTNRKLVDGERFLPQIEKLLTTNAKAIVLREKDLEEKAYERVAKRVLEIAAERKERIILHNFWKTALALGIKKIHVPLHVLEQIPEIERNQFSVIGTSVHSLEQLMQVQRLGVSYVFAGHIFATDCKKGLAPRGLSFLKEICEASQVPVYAIGGIKKENAEGCMENGAKGICLMSGCMYL